MRVQFLILIVLLVLLSCRSSSLVESGEVTVHTMPNSNEKKTTKNIILMIGDGMGLAQITAGIYDNNNFLNFEKFPVTGLMKTHSYDNLVTDSAAGGTAMACGVKTYNNAVGVDKDGIPVRSILEQAEEKEMTTGIVVTSALVNATPATFMAHQKLRAFSEPIAEEIANSGVDFLVGGGKKYFDRRNSDERNLVKEMEAKGYQIEDFIRNRKIQDVRVTADHETGGLTIKEGSKLKKVKPNFAYGRHTGVMVPVFAYGPGSEKFTGIFDNTELYRKMKSALAL